MICNIYSTSKSLKLFGKNLLVEQVVLTGLVRLLVKAL